MLRVIFRETCDSPCGFSAILFPHKKRYDNIAERIIHNAVSLMPREISTELPVAYLVGSILPDLTDEHRLGVCIFKLPVKRLRKFLRQLIQHIKPPTAYSCIKPPMKHTLFRMNNKIHVGRCGFLYCREYLNTPPACIFFRVLLKIIPVVKS